MFQFKLTLIIAISFFAIIPEKATGQEELQFMKAELAELRKELATVRKERDTLRQELAALKGEITPKDSKPPEGEINGIVWEVTFLRPDKTPIISRKFLALDGKIFYEHKEIGTYTETGARTRVDITRSEAPRSNGVYHFVRITNDPPAYEGRFTNNFGDSLVARLRIVRD